MPEMYFARERGAACQRRTKLGMEHDLRESNRGRAGWAMPPTLRYADTESGDMDGGSVASSAGYSELERLKMEKNRFLGQR